jgi:hypothetical protein
MKITRTRWWKNRVIVEGPYEDTDNMWKEIATHIRNVAIEMFGVTRGNKRESKDT